MSSALFSSTKVWYSCLGVTSTISLASHLISSQLIKLIASEVRRLFLRILTVLPWINPWPVTTPSPKYFSFSMPNSSHLWVFSLSYSLKLPSSRSRFTYKLKLKQKQKLSLTDQSAVIDFCSVLSYVNFAICHFISELL